MEKFMSVQSNITDIGTNLNRLASNFKIWFTFVCGIICILAGIIFSIKFAIENPPKKQSKPAALLEEPCKKHKCGFSIDGFVKEYPEIALFLLGLVITSASAIYIFDPPSIFKDIYLNFFAYSTCFAVIYSSLCSLYMGSGDLLMKKDGTVVNAVKHKISCSTYYRALISYKTGAVTKLHLSSYDYYKKSIPENGSRIEIFYSPDLDKAITKLEIHKYRMRIFYAVCALIFCTAGNIVQFLRL